MKFENCIYDHMQLADRFLMMAEKFLPFAKSEKYHIDMGLSQVEHNDCGTVACHGGYGCIIFGLVEDFYTDGADQIAKYLGFVDSLLLTEFADKYPKIWGNSYGGDMFSSRMAFGIQSMYSPIHLIDVVRHYICVAERLMKLEDE